MRERSVATVIIVGVVAALLLVTPQTANAGCKKLYPSGPLICASWITGSAVCQLLLQGFKGPIQENGVITCGIFGTESDSEPSCVPPLTYDADNLYPDCTLVGKAACYNPQYKYNEFGTAFNLPGPLFELATTVTCDRKGKCTTEATVEPEGNGGVCNNNWELEFTPEKFYGQVCICPGGFDANWDCCADGERKNGFCKKYNVVNDIVGVADCLTESCTWAGDGDFYLEYSFGQPLADAYECSAVGGI